MNPRRRLMWKNKARLRAQEEPVLSAVDVDLVADEVSVEVQKEKSSQSHKKIAPGVAVKETVKRPKKKVSKPKTSKGD